MNRPYALAAVLALFAAAIRTWDGETGPLKVVRELDLGREVVAFFHLTWSMCIAIVSSVFVWHPGTAIPMSVTILVGVLALLGAGKSIRADHQQ